MTLGTPELADPGVCSGGRRRIEGRFGGGSAPGAGRQVRGGESRCALREKGKAVPPRPAAPRQQLPGLKELSSLLPILLLPLTGFVTFFPAP